MTDNSRAVVVTVDAGSGSCRALAWDQSGQMLGLSQQEWDYEPSEYPGGMNFNTKDGWRRATECIKAALSQAGLTPDDVKAVTATSMREGFVVYDENGEEIWAVPNADARAQKEAEEIIKEGLAEPIYRRGGDWTSIAASARLRWIEANAPEIWEKARHMTMLGDWVLQKLSGEYVTDPSLGSSSGLFDLATRDWSSETAEELGVSRLLPRVAESGTVVGEVSKKAAEETGLKEGTPVVAGGADTQLGLLGGGVVDANTFGVVGGTFWLTAGVADTALIDPDIRLRTLCHVVPDRWMIEGVGFVHGLSTRYVRDGILRAANPDISTETGYGELDELAAQCSPRLQWRIVLRFERHERQVVEARPAFYSRAQPLRHFWDRARGRLPGRDGRGSLRCTRAPGDTRRSLRPEGRSGHLRRRSLAQRDLVPDTCGRARRAGAGAGRPGGDMSRRGAMRPRRRRRVLRPRGCGRRHGRGQP